MKNKKILYVAHGEDHFLQEAAYSILSLFSVASSSDYVVAIVTDKGELIKKLLGPEAQINILPINQKIINQWKGEDGYVHRIKPKAIQWAIKKIGEKDDLFLFVDSDTVFYENPDSIFKKIQCKNVVMDEMEGSVEKCRDLTSSQRKMYRVVCSDDFNICGVRRKIGLNTQLWNSGVIGVDFDDRDVFSDVLLLIDEMYKKLPIMTIEQIALSIVLQEKKIHIRDNENIIFHYHFFKEFRNDLRVFFERYKNSSLDEKIGRIGEISPRLRCVPKIDFHKNPKILRQFLKIIGFRWKSLPYPWE